MPRRLLYIIIGKAYEAKCCLTRTLVNFIKSYYKQLPNSCLNISLSFVVEERFLFVFRFEVSDMSPGRQATPKKTTQRKKQQKEA